MGKQIKEEEGEESEQQKGRKGGGKRLRKGILLLRCSGRARERDPWIRMHKVLAEDTSVFPRNYVVRFTAHCNFIPREDIASVCWTLGTPAFTCIYPHKDIHKEINNYK